MKSWKLLMLGPMCSVLMLSVAAAQQGQTQQQGRPQQPEPQGQAQANQSPGQGQHEQLGAEKNADRPFVRESIRTNLFEVAVGKHVADRAQNPQVKQFAQTMVDYHSKANERLKQVAQQIGVEAPDSMNAWQQAVVQYVRQLQSPELDREYIFHQAGTHHIKLLNHGYVILNGSNAQVQQLAKDMVPDLKDHLQQATQISDQIIRGGAATANRGEPARQQSGRR